MSGFIYGLNPVRELLRRRPKEVEQVLIGRKEQGIEEIIELAKSVRAQIKLVTRGELDQITQTREHQGIAAKASLPQAVALEDILKKVTSKPEALILFLDQIEDPQNLGAIARSAECADADALVIPERRSAGITPASLKASAGALEWVPFSIITNLSRALEQTKEAGFWSYAAQASAKENIWQTKFSKKSAILIGSEGKGIRPLVQRTCDFQISIPLFGKIQSLNASVSAAIMLYEYRRQFPAT